MVRKEPRPEPPILAEVPKKRGMRDIRKTVEKEIKRQPELKKIYIARYCLITFGVIILLIGIVISYQNFVNMSDEQLPLQESGHEFMTELHDYDGLKLNPSRGTSIWDANKYLTVTSEDISIDLETETEFLVEVYDLSSYHSSFNRTVDNGQAWSSVVLSRVDDSMSDNRFIISTMVNIYVTPEEVHLARVTVTVWK